MKNPNDKLVTPKTFNLAKKKGYIHNENSLYIMPSQSYLKKWLRDKFNIIVDVATLYEEHHLPITKNNNPKPKGYFIWENWNGDFCEDNAKIFDTYEEALEYGLILHCK